MPTYKPLTIMAEFKPLEEAVKAAQKKVMEKQKPLPTDIEKMRKAMTKMLAACDVAEWNNRQSIEYKLAVHGQAKIGMGELVQLVGALEKHFDKSTYEDARNTAAEVKQCALRLDEDEKKLQQIPMEQQYRKNGWSEMSRKALDFVPDCKSAYQLRSTNREKGIQEGKLATSQADRIKEYVERADALVKTAELTRIKAFGVEESASKVKEEAEDFIKSGTKAAEEIRFNLKGRVSGASRRAQGVEKLDKKKFDELLMLEANTTSVMKDAKGRLKTMKLQLAELKKRAEAAGLKDFESLSKPLSFAIDELDKEVKEADQALVPYWGLLKKGRELKL